MHPVGAAIRAQIFRLGEDDVAEAVLSVVRTGYARDPKRAIDADDLAEAAIARIRATQR